MDAEVAIEEFKKISKFAETIKETEIKDLVSQALCCLVNIFLKFLHIKNFSFPLVLIIQNKKYQKYY